MPAVIQKSFKPAKIQKEKGVNGKRCQIYFPKELLVFSSMLSVFTAILCSLCALLSVVFCATKKVRFQQKVIGIPAILERPLLLNFVSFFKQFLRTQKERFVLFSLVT